LLSVLVWPVLQSNTWFRESPS